MKLAKKLSVWFYRWAWKIKPIDKNTQNNRKQGDTKTNGKN